LAQPGLNKPYPRGDGDKKEFVTGESTKETVKTIARGKPGDSGATVVTTVCLLPIAHGLRVLRAPGFPRSLSLSRDKIDANLGRYPRREKAKSYPKPRHVIARSPCDEAIQSFFAARRIASLRSQ
jgi:hypothetical protein